MPWVFLADLDAKHDSHEDDSRYAYVVFSVNEFARLIVLFSSNDCLRSALLQSGLERTREQIDTRVRRDAFWSTTVAPMFNNPRIRPQFDFRDVLDGVQI